MMKEVEKPSTVDDYILRFPLEVQEILEQVRVAVRKAAPEAEEIISYAMPAFRYKKTNLVYFAGFKQHIGFYALPSGNDAFKKELSNYKVGKGSIQFPLDKPIPLDLIKRIVQFRIEEVDENRKGTS
jgi:uncharacterized protein YdhG (YjbR/CyaY superfamily)